MRILGRNRVTAGKRHAWYDTDMSFPVRKPIQVEVQTNGFAATEYLTEIKTSWWSRFVMWIKSKIT